MKRADLAAAIARTERELGPLVAAVNCAGIAGADVSTVSASTGTFRILTVSPQKLEGRGGSIDQLPAAVGFVLKKPFNWETWTFGFAIVRTAAVIVATVAEPVASRISTATNQPRTSVDRLVANAIFALTGTLTDLKPHVLRYWESQFKLLNPAKNRSGSATCHW